MEHGHGHGHEHSDDPIGKMVGVQAALLAVGLTIVTILSHRAHTEGVMARAEANDQWSYYQATKIKLHNVELGSELVTALNAKGEAADKALERFHADKEKYEKKSDKIKEEAEEKEHECKHVEKQAARFDLGEGMLEIGLVLSSLYFISHRKIFPNLGLLSGLAGIGIAVTAFFA